MKIMCLVPASSKTLFLTDGPYSRAFDSWKPWTDTGEMAISTTTPKSEPLTLIPPYLHRRLPVSLPKVQVLKPGKLNISLIDFKIGDAF